MIIFKHLKKLDDYLYVYKTLLFAMINVLKEIILPWHIKLEEQISMALVVFCLQTARKT